MIMGLSNSINKNKKHIYVLIAGVVALWGVIFFRIYATIDNRKESPVQVSPKKVAYFKMVNHLNDEVSLGVAYRDPFSVEQFMPAIETSVTVNKVMPIKPPLNWPIITYTGYLNNINSQQKMVIIMVNEKELMFAEGQSLNGVKLLKYAGDSIQVQYQQESKYIKLKSR